MAYDLAMNMSDGDLLIDDTGNLLVIDNAERVAQQIHISLRFWLGEWFLDTSQGVPYFEYILVKNPNLAHVTQVLSEAITAVEGVRQVQSITPTFDRLNRRFAVEYEAVTEYGLVTRKEVLKYGREQ